METWLELGAAGALFAAAIVVGVMLGWLWPRGLQQALDALGRGLAVIDTLLVERVSWLFGLHWVKGRFARIGRWGLLIAMFVALAVTGAFAPLMFALAALLLSVIGVLAAVRRWGWDEEDRANEVPQHLRRLQGDEDLIHEAMFAIACMFLVAPLLFYRLDQAFSLFDIPSGLGPWAHAAYTLGEFLKAVPLLDYSEVYSVQNISGVTATGLGGRHATFAFRMLMDLALIAGVLQLLSVMQRVASGRDLRRLQGVLDGDDAGAAQSAIETLSELGLRNQSNAKRALVAVLDNPERYPLELRGNAANALKDIGNTLVDKSLLLTAIDGYRALLRDWTRESAPEQWATTQNNLGAALAVLGSRGDDNASRAAIAAHRLALEVRTRESAPADWAATQINLGAALVLGARGDDTALREAIAAFRLALKVYKRESTPRNWAATQINLGAALAMLGERGDDEALREAIAADRSALEVYTRESAPEQWATAQNNLGGALQTLGEHGDDDALREAIAAFRLALEVRTRESRPADWAATQNRLGGVLRTLGERDDDEALREAVAAHRLALKVYKRESTPAHWAATQNYLGGALEARGGRTSDAADWRAAAECYRSALEVWTPVAYPPDHENASRSLVRVQGKLGEP
ncbi:tetratricopeptide repeat protein [Candidatus Viadribacter manganicus]|uniref:Tetratricopeptide repeat protein n=1 Tax=Candidatus Viadribacter manganicus TaxID=1759059 RepID=A0A1B1AHL4_9PROT|nr:tetratricopeptide repeat protein [Candidatus Viadribacter manganicus]ANP46047.1 hypothetical protein ATE48_08995 [Candidatus Viadribacter manganicus]